MDINAAIDFLIDSSDEAITQIDAQIEGLEGKLQRLRRARSVLAKARGEHKAAKAARTTRKAKLEKDGKLPDGQLPYWNSLEEKIFDIVSTSKEPMTCSDIAHALGPGYPHTSIGRTVNKSQRLAKEGSYIVVIS